MLFAAYRKYMSKNFNWESCKSELLNATKHERIDSNWERNLPKKTCSVEMPQSDMDG